MTRTTIRSEDITAGQVKAADLANPPTVWQSITTATTLTAVAGNGYPINTTSNVCTVTLPASASAGDTIEFVDYARKWGTNAVTINQNSLKYQGYTSPNPVYNTAGESLRIVYVDATQGWVPVFDGAVVNEVPQTSDIEWLVIAGGGGGGTGTASAGLRAGGAGGAGGYRNSFASEASGGGASTETPITGMAEGIVLTATIGAGGAGGSGNIVNGTVGVDSSLIGTGISVTAAGGGFGGRNSSTGGAGGSGGGGGTGVGTRTGGSGTSNQGYAGADGGNETNSAGGGGGAAAVGSPHAVSPSDTGGAGGAGLNNTITGASVGRGGGGGGGGSSAGGAATHGGGNGGNGTSGAVGLPGTANTGGGGGGQGDGPTFTGGTGGSGVVILRLLTASYSGTTTGSPTVATDGSHTVITFTGTGTYTV